MPFFVVWLKSNFIRRIISNFRVWQHTICIGIKKESIPDAHLCEMCESKKSNLTQVEATNIQKTTLLEKVNSEDLGKILVKDGAEDGNGVKRNGLGDKRIDIGEK